jgi:hypothetical protein
LAWTLFEAWKEPHWISATHRKWQIFFTTLFLRL